MEEHDHALGKRVEMKFSGKTATAVIEFPEDKILLVKRGTVVFKGYWALPGGRVDAGETVEQTVLREVKEETGLDVEIIGRIGDYHEFGVKDGIEYDYYPTCFLAKPVGGVPERQEEEIEEMKLFDVEEIPENLAFEHADMIKDYKRTKQLTRIHGEVRKCERCRLRETRTNAVPGEGPINAQMMICGQASGRKEDKEGRPFVGMAGEFLNKLLDTMKLDRQKIFITSPIKCFPPNNRPPRSDELKACRPYLEQQIRLVKPRIIVALGNYALQALLDRKEKVSRIHGIPQATGGVIVFPTFHPAAAMRFPEIREKMTTDSKKLIDLLRNLSLL